MGEIKKVFLKKENSNELIVERCEIANSMFSRMKGLLGKSELFDDEGLLITPCNSVHTFFMNFKIDVVFLNSEDKVVFIKQHLKPWRITKLVFGATKVLELPNGKADAIKIGDKICFE